MKERSARVGVVVFVEVIVEFIERLKGWWNRGCRRNDRASLLEMERSAVRGWSGRL